MIQLTDPRKTPRQVLAPALVLAAFVGALLSAQDKPADKLRADKEALAPLQGLVGKWKGSGFLRRGSTKGSWREDTTWAWKFTEGRAYLEFNTPGARHLRKGRLEATRESGRFSLNVELPNEGGDALYRGAKNKDDKLVLDRIKAERKDSPAPARISLGLLVKGKRLVVLYEGRNAKSGRYYRLGEVGYTLSGTSISSGSGQPECVVTGGRGTIRVEHKGKDYTVCCKGCLEAFRDDPEAILAEWSKRRKEELERKKSGGKNQAESQ